MAWRDQLLPASFRGVEFFYSETEGEGGRRTVSHEFPLRDAPYAEDLGRRQRRFRIAAYVLGPDYFAGRDDLIDALEQPGPGTLVHPYRGRMTVNPGTYRCAERVEQGGSAFFEIEFFESGSQPSPVSSADTSVESVTVSASAATAISGQFAGDFDITSLPSTLAAKSAALVTQLRSDMTSLLKVPNLVIGDAAATIASLQQLMTLPGQFADAVTGLFNEFADSVALILPADDPTTSSRGLAAPADPSFGLAGMAAWQQDAAPITGTSPALLQAALNQAALITLVQGAATAALVRLYAQTDFTSQGDAEAARDQCNDLIDAQATIAGDDGQNAAYAAWLALAAAAANDLTTRGKQLPDVVTRALPQALPSLAVAQLLYQDASRADELVARNAPPHPLFMPLQVEALSS